MSVDTVPKSMKQLRACLVCSLVKTFDQFESDGCDNCESVLHLKRNRDNVYDCTSSNFEVRQELDTVNTQESQTLVVRANLICSSKKSFL